MEHYTNLVAMDQYRRDCLDLGETKDTRQQAGNKPGKEATASNPREREEITRSAQIPALVV